MTVTDSSLRLARDLKLRDRAQLISLVTQRKISGAHIRDFFDLADAFLDSQNIMDALARVTRTTLVQLADGDVNSDNELVHSLALATESPDGRLVALEEVTLTARLALEKWNLKPSDAQPASRLRDSVRTGEPNEKLSENQERDRVGIERGLLLTTAIDDLAQAIALSPVRRLASGNLAAADAVRLGLNIEHAGLSLADALGFASHARLIHFVDGWYMAGSDFDDWQLANPAQRWVTLALAWHQSLDRRVADILREQYDWGSALDAYVRWLYPLDSAWILDLVSSAVRNAAHLGLVTSHVRIPLAEVALRGDAVSLAARANESLPEMVTQVYIQNDLTIVAPGLLQPEADDLLRRLCDVEHSGLASTFRITSTRVTHAMTLGLTPDAILSRLEEISASPLPQPVRYLVEESGSRFGAIRVREWGGGSFVTARDAELLDLLLADSALASLAWDRGSPTTATTRRDALSTLDVLVAEKHPAVLEDEDGNVVARPRSVSLPVISKPVPVPAAHTLVDRVVSDGAAITGNITTLDDGAAWRERQVSLAIREKATLQLTFGMPDGSSKSMTVVPLSVANGRLRARDTATDVERTLPMASIVTLTTGVA